MQRVSLSELEPHWLKVSDNPVPLLFFNCPKCKNDHVITLCFQQPSIFPSGAVWTITSCSHSFAIMSVHPSINVPSCGFHGWIREGFVEW